MDWPLILIISGSLMTIAGTAFKAHEDSKSQKQLVKQQADSLEKSKKIEELNQKLIAYSIGGDGFPFIGCFIRPHTNDVCHFYITNQGSYPMFDVKVNITDLVKINDIKDKRITSSEFQNALDGVRHHIGTLPPGPFENELIMKVDPKGKNKVFLIFNITTRNNFFIQRTKGIRFSGKMHFAYQVSDNNGSRVVFEKIPSEFRAHGLDVWAKIEKY